jgi:hypothetical protein
LFLGAIVREGEPKILSVGDLVSVGINPFENFAAIRAVASLTRCAKPLAPRFGLTT